MLELASPAVCRLPGLNFSASKSLLATGGFVKPICHYLVAHSNWESFAHKNTSNNEHRRFKGYALSQNAGQGEKKLPFYEEITRYGDGSSNHGHDQLGDLCAGSPGRGARRNPDYGFAYPSHHQYDHTYAGNCRYHH